MNNRFVLVAAVIALAGCGAIKPTTSGAVVELSNARPDTACRYLGEAVGSQGNWFTGDYTANSHLMEGARNDLRNKAAALGGNFVWVQNVSNAQAHGALGTSNTTAVGNVYACPGSSETAAPRSVVTSTTPTEAGRQPITTPESGVIASQPREASDGLDVQEVLAAQNVASGQGCDGLKAIGGGRFVAQCGTFRLLIECQDDSCRPIRALKE